MGRDTSESQSECVEIISTPPQTPLSSKGRPTSPPLSLTPSTSRASSPSRQSRSPSPTSSSSLVISRSPSPYSPSPTPSIGAASSTTKEHHNQQPSSVAVLTYEQVRRLNDVLTEAVTIHGRGNFPVVEVRLRDLVRTVRTHCDQEGVTVREVRLNGGAASHVLASGSQPYNDLDLIFAVDLGAPKSFEKVKSAVLAALLTLLPAGVSRARLAAASVKDAYVSKLVKVHEGDRWSLLALGHRRAGDRGRTVELKFVDTMRRQFEFSVDSFQIILDSLLCFYACADMPISEQFYPTVLGESVYGDFDEALTHLQRKLIATRRPEEIRGGGLLKYCSLLVRGFRPACPEQLRLLERYMCSRFFIDFPAVEAQRVKLDTYLEDHFGGADAHLCACFLSMLHAVVSESTVCLMGHERRQTLALIEELTALAMCQESCLLSPPPTAAPAPAAAAPHVPPYHSNHHHQQAQPVVYYYAPVMPCYPCACACSCTAWMPCS